MLDDAARHGAERGATAVAAELAEHALRLTPPDERDERHRRALAAARAHQAAGEWTRARTIATDLLAETELGSLRAEVLVLLAELESADRAAALLEEALSEASVAPGAAVGSSTAGSRGPTRFRNGFVAALEHARAALELADEARRRRAPGRARVDARAVLGWLVGDAEAPAHAARAHELATAARRRARCFRRRRRPSRTRSRRSREDRRGPRSCSSASTRSGASATSRAAPARSGASPGSSSGPALGARGRPRRPRARHQRPVRARGAAGPPPDRRRSPSIAASSSSPASSRSARSRSREEQLGLHPPHAPRGPRARRALERRRASAALEWLDKADRQAATLGWGEPSIRWWTRRLRRALLELGRIDDAVRVARRLGGGRGTGSAASGCSRT